MGIWKNIVKIIGNNGNIADVNEDGQLHIVAEGKVSDGNSSNTPLGIDGVFTGTSVETLPFAVIVVSVFSDQVSAADGLVIQQSADGVNWDHDDKFTIPANTGKTFSFQPQAKYLRVVYTNGGIAQSDFRLQTTLKKTYVKPSSHRIQDPIIDEDDAELTKSVLTGIDSTGTYRNVKMTQDGNLTISDNSSGLAISKNDVSGATFIHKFGAAPNFDIGDLFATVWDGADNGDIAEPRYIYSTTADIDSLSSAAAGDTQDIEIQGLDADYNLVIQTIALNGQNRVALTTNLIRVFRMKNVDNTDLTDHCYVFVNTALLGGVPIDTTKVRAMIHDENNQTEMAVYTIPAGKTGYLRDWYASTAGAKKDSAHTILVKARPFGQVFQLKHKSNITVTGTSYIQHRYMEPKKFTEKTDIEMQADTDQDAAGVSGGFDIVLIDN